MTTETVLTEKDVLSIIDDAIGNPDLEPADCLRDYEVLIRKAELAVLQSPEIHRLQDDAGRYRWLRKRLIAVDFEYGEPKCIALVFEMPSRNTVFSADCDANVDLGVEQQP